MESRTVYLVSGANRGIGHAIVTQLAARSDAIVFAGARNPAGATDLQALAQANPDRFHILKLESADKDNNVAAVEEIKRIAGHLDVVIANAGIGEGFEAATGISPQVMLKHYEINSNGPLVLFQAAHPLLKESKTPKFVAISSGIGSIALASKLPVLAYPYGASKAALNWIMRKLHHDFSDFTIFPINPGAVMTDLAAHGREKAPGMKELQDYISLITPEESAKGILEQIDVATRETHGGQFVDYTGLGKLTW
ncbi:NAD(P)-binding protein [Schizophyllum commune H4-8]|uniref:NAD(P)-binding protein n=1 Tax=Schizophyllum commune (strain H4-8 / FGSC 9210) TaxID=578458 RepID=D8Q4Y1_SCHCM|nr:NAD(P)-binding protein [Schizophyllum commune H4-8]KAI5892419.1 NAD(P)-binding protein [Schizophyllum commune H4-8]